MPTVVEDDRLSGKARARAVTSAICGSNSQASKVSPSGASWRTPRGTRVGVEPGRGVRERTEHFGVGVVRADVADAAEPPVAGGDLAPRAPRRRLAERQIGVADDPGAGAERAVDAARRLAATPLTNSTSPTGFSSGGPSAR